MNHDSALAIGVEQNPPVRESAAATVRPFFPVNKLIRSQQIRRLCSDGPMGTRVLTADTGLTREILSIVLLDP